MIRDIIVWGDHFYTLYNQLDIKVKRKVDYVFWLIRYTEKRVVVINWFFKKSKKAPKNEIELGERIKTEYLEIKKRRK
jgi:phage-related protein